MIFMAHSSNRRWSSAGVVRLVLIVVSLIFVVSVMRPTFSSRSISKPKTNSTALASCPRCSCDCLSEVYSFSLTSDIFNMSASGCSSEDPEMNKEMKKDFVTLLSEEIKLQKDVTLETLEHTKASTIDTKRLASHYQNEAQKCYARTVTCEVSRSRAEAALLEERKLTMLWEKRARDSGWSDKERLQSKSTNY